jgi:hypothetical protein
MLVCRVLHGSGVVESVGRVRVCVPVGSARARIVLRFDTFAVLVTVVGTLSVSKLVVMDAVCIGGEGSRV